MGAESNEASSGASLTEPLRRFDLWWTRVDARLCGILLLTEAALLVTWVVLAGLSTETELGSHAAGATGGQSSDRAGLVVRAILGASAFGTLVHMLLRPRENESAAWKKKYALAVTGAVLAGALGSVLWLKTGTVYFSNFINWLNTSSTLAMVGGLRGLATFLTLWVALLGGSLATAQGKHINVDVVQRSLGEKGRIAVSALVWLAAGALSLAASIGFADYIAVTGYKLNPANAPCVDNPRLLCDVPPSAKLKQVVEETKQDVFLLGRQMSLDLMTLPKVVSGVKYNEFLTAKDWNAWVASANWEAHFAKEDLVRLRADEDDTQKRQPVITVPGRGEGATRLLGKELNLIFPIGLLMIAIRFLVRVILVLTGHVNVDPDAAHGGDHAPTEAPALAKEGA